MCNSVLNELEELVSKYIHEEINFYDFKGFIIGKSNTLNMI